MSEPPTPIPTEDHRTLGVVVIGRNEGERLVRCLESVRGRGGVVYVDSGSTDGSVDTASRLGAEVIRLDMSKPFTAARARNAGFTRLRELNPSVRYVQFVDGDCEVREGWLSAGVAALEAQPGVAVVCGRLRERHPEHSIYNRMCDFGWDYPIGEIASCGGVAMYLAECYVAAGGFNESLIAGEEFELCSRFRRAGGRVVRVDCEMAWHDVGITRFGQWWRRAVRSGFGAAEGWFLYDSATGAELRRRTLRAAFWGGLIPALLVASLAIAIWSRLGWFLAGGLMSLWALNFVRLFTRELTRRHRWRDAMAIAAFSVIGKFAELRGVIEYWQRRLSGSRARLIEYRGS
ncbi:MAG: glycosyltransferase [Planctomycetes bacterium]|nr:glycosyltransferase [Planctomycetota bacterium]